jgi:hypothetical protein
MRPPPARRSASPDNGGEQSRRELHSLLLGHGRVRRTCAPWRRCASSRKPRGEDHDLVLEPGRRPAAEALAWAKACALASHGLSASRGGAVGSAVSRVAPERGGAVLLDAGRSRRRAGDGAGKGERRRFCWRPGGAGRQRRLQSLIEILLSACCRTKICTCPAIAGTILPTGQIGRARKFLMLNCKNLR